MMRFKIKWLGYNAPTWEPFKNMAHVEKVHKYLKAKGFDKFIPAIYQDSEQPTRKKPRRETER